MGLKRRRPGKETPREGLERLPEPDGKLNKPPPVRPGSIGLDALPPPEFIPPWPSWAGTPTLLLVDDEQGFLDSTDLHWKTHYRGDFFLHTLHPRDQDPVAWIRRRLDEKAPLDAVFLDRNIPGEHGEAILRRLRRDVPASRDLPVVIVTAYPTQGDAADASALAAGAQRFMYKRSPTFLYEAALAVTQLQEAAEDEMWVDLTQKIAEGIAKRTPLATTLGDVARFFQDHFKTTACYGRELKQNGSLCSLTPLDPKDPFGARDCLPQQAIPPFMDSALNQNGAPQTQRYDSLTLEQIGRFEKLLGYKAIVSPFTYGWRLLGTLSVYRSPEGKAFRQKDEHFLSHLAMQIGALLGSNREREEIRERQTELLDFVREVSELNQEEDILDVLVGRLHQDIQEDSESAAKTTIRVLDPGTGEINRRRHKGIPIGKESEWTKDQTLYNKRAVYASVIRHRNTRRNGNVTEDAVFLPTVKGIRSHLTVPLLASGLCLGAVNLEHRRQDYYSQEGQAYVEALCRVAAESLLRIRARGFQLGLLELVNLLAKGSERLLPEAFRLLYGFTRFSRLLHLKPDPANPHAAWQVQQVYGLQGEPAEEKEVPLWCLQIKNKWAQSFIHQSLTKRSQYLQYTETEFIEDPIDLRTDSQAVLLIFSRSESRDPIALLSLHFRVRQALNQFQQKLLRKFGLFIGELIVRDREMQRVFGEVSVARQQGRIGMAFSQFRHALVSQTGTIGNALNDLRRGGGDTSVYVERIQGVLDEIDESLDDARQLAKVPVFDQVDIAAIWDQRIEKMVDLAERKGVSAAGQGRKFLRV